MSTIEEIQKFNSKLNYHFSLVIDEFFWRFPTLEKDIDYMYADLIKQGIFDCIPLFTRESDIIGLRINPHNDLQEYVLIVGGSHQTNTIGLNLKNIIPALLVLYRYELHKYTNELITEIIGIHKIFGGEEDIIHELIREIKPPDDERFLNIPYGLRLIAKKDLFYEELALCFDYQSKEEEFVPLNKTSCLYPAKLRSLIGKRQEMGIPKRTNLTNEIIANASWIELTPQLFALNQVHNAAYSGVYNELMSWLEDGPCFFTTLEKLSEEEIKSLKMDTLLIEATLKAKEQRENYAGDLHLKYAIQIADDSPSKAFEALLTSSILYSYSLFTAGGYLLYSSKPASINIFEEFKKLASINKWANLQAHLNVVEQYLK
jgi:hypothetical protein